MKEDDGIKQKPINISVHTHIQRYTRHRDTDNSAVIARGEGWV